MYKRLLVVSFTLLVYHFTIACDLCTIYIGIQPNDYKNTFGVRYRYRVFEKDYYAKPFNTVNPLQKTKGRLGEKHGNNDEHLTTTEEKVTYTEVYNSYDVYANFFLNQRFQIGMNTYFADNYVLINDSIIDNVGGIGDVTLTLKYQLSNSKKSTDSLLTNKLVHRLTIGGGFNLKTGNFNKYSVTSYNTSIISNDLVVEPVKELDPHIQSGTGSFGYLFLLEYLTKWKNLGFNGNISYRMNTTNKNGFRFANRLNVNTSLFVLIKLSKKVKIMPNTGVSFETSNRDQLNDTNFKGSGGKALFFNSGINIFINQLGLEFSYYLPVYENLLDDQLFNQKRIITQLAYYF